MEHGQGELLSLAKRGGDVTLHSLVCKRAELLWPGSCSMATCARDPLNNPGAKYCTDLCLSFAICKMVFSTCCVKYLEICPGEKIYM